MSDINKDYNLGAISVSVRMVQDQSEEINYEREMSDEEINAFLYKNKKELFDKKIEQELARNQPQEHVKRVDMDLDTQGNHQREYRHTKYNDMEIGEDSISLRIDIKTDMKL